MTVAQCPLWAGSMENAIIPVLHRNAELQRRSIFVLEAQRKRGRDAEEAKPFANETKLEKMDRKEKKQVEKAAAKLAANKTRARKTTRDDTMAALIKWDWVTGCCSAGCSFNVLPKGSSLEDWANIVVDARAAIYNKIHRNNIKAHISQWWVGPSKSHCME